MKHAFVLAAIGMLATMSFADPVSPSNDRPVTVGTAPTGEDSLQDVLDDFFGAPGGTSLVDDFEDQKQAGYFRVALPGSSSINPQLFQEQSSNASINEFGLFTLPELDDSNTIVRVKLFDGADTGDGTAFGSDASIVKWDSPTTGEVNFTDDFEDLFIYGFGVYIKTTDGNGGDQYWYSLDDLNDGAAKILAYNDGNTNWGFAFEDGTDGDFNDAFIGIESIAPVPEPGTLALCGIALLGGFVLRRRRRQTA